MVPDVRLLARKQGNGAALASGRFGCDDYNGAPRHHVPFDQEPEP